MLQGLVYLPPKRKTTFRERLWRWQLHVAVSAFTLALFAYMFSGIGFEHPDRARDVAFFAVLPLAVVNGVYAVFAWRYQQGGERKGLRPSAVAGRLLLALVLLGVTGLLASAADQSTTLSWLPPLVMGLGVGAAMAVLLTSTGGRCRSR